MEAEASTEPEAERTVGRRIFHFGTIAKCNGRQWKQMETLIHGGSCVTEFKPLFHS